jgi:hypothetical protein
LSSFLEGVVSELEFKLLVLAALDSPRIRTSPPLLYTSKTENLLSNPGVTVRV